MSSDAGIADQMKRSPSLSSDTPIPEVQSEVEEEPEGCGPFMFLKRSDAASPCN